MRIALFKDSRASFLQDLSEAGIDFEESRPIPGRIMASATYVAIAQIATVSGAVASVLVAWIKARASRKVILTLKDQKIVHLEGYSAKEVEALLKITESVAVIDTKPIENQSNQTLQPTASGGV